MTLASGYRGAILTPREEGGCSFHEDAVLCVDPAGSVIGVFDPGATPPGLGWVHDLCGALVIPGLVDVHLHCAQTRVVGSASGPLLEWLERTVFPEEARFRHQSYASLVAAEFVAACARRGTTTVGAWATSSSVATASLFQALDEAGLRGVVGMVLMDQNCPDDLRVDAVEALAEARALVDAWHGHDAGRLRFAATPRFAITCSRRLLEGAAGLSRELGLPVMTHVAENAREGQETLAVHPWAKDYLDVYDAVGLVHERTLLAHAIHLDASSWDRIAERGAAVAHCPDSNFFLGSGVMRLAEPRTRGVRVGLGTDVAAGRSFDVRRTVSYAWDASLLAGSGATPEELFTLATLGGARALGLAAETGTLEPGKQADFVVLERSPAMTGREGALRAATFASDDAPVLRTYVRGRRVWPPAG